MNILNNAHYVGETLDYTPDDRITVPVPLYHCFGMVIGSLCALTHGSSCIFPDAGFDPVTTLEAVTAEKTTSMLGVPTMFLSLIDEYKKNPD
jgi:fatty-acyl-CoA synthase